MFRLIMLTILTATSLATLAQTPPPPPPVRPALATFCQAYRSERERSTRPGPRFAVVREVMRIERRSGSSGAPVLKPHELHMVQTTALQSSSVALTPPQAVELFFDLRNPSSDKDGSIVYLDVTNTVTNKKKELALLTFQPGDNEYGLLFAIVRAANNPMQVVGTSLVGSVQDGDLYCYDVVQ